jgi:hypothetical protein
MRVTGDININDLATAIQRFKKLRTRPMIVEADVGRQHEVRTVLLGPASVLTVSFEVEVPERKHRKRK